MYSQTLINCAITDTFMNTVQLLWYSWFMDAALLVEYSQPWEHYGHKQLDNMHTSVPEHNYQYDKYSHEFSCIMWTIIMSSYQICSIYKSSKGVNKY